MLNRSATPRLTSALCTLVAASVLAGCRTDAPRIASFAIDDVPEYRLREVFRLGGADAPEHLSFRREPSFAVHRSGLLFALHSQQGRVAVLDSLGGFVRWIGRRGSGPGEFQNAIRMGFVGDTLWVRNFPSPRVSSFLLDGSHVSTERTPSYDFGYHLTAAAGVSGYLAGGKAWVEAEGFVMGEDRAIDLPLLVGDRTLSTLDTLFTIPNPRGRLEGLAFAPFPVPPFHDIATDGSTIMLAEWSDTLPSELAVQLHTIATSERRTVTMRFDERTVPSAVRDSVITAGVEAIRALGERLRALGLPEGTFPTSISRAEVEDAVYLPRHFPPIRRILVGLDETIWVERTDGVQRGPWVALDLNGTPLFQISLPESATLRQAARNAVWATDRDSLDVSYLVRWNIGAK